MGNSQSKKVLHDKHLLRTQRLDMFARVSNYILELSVNKTLFFPSYKSN